MEMHEQIKKQKTLYEVDMTVPFLRNKFRKKIYAAVHFFSSQFIDFWLTYQVSCVSLEFTSEYFVLFLGYPALACKSKEVGVLLSYIY